MAKKLVVLLDSGDTLIDESTQARDDRGIVQSAGWIDGARELLVDLGARLHWLPRRRCWSTTPETASAVLSLAEERGWHVEVVEALRVDEVGRTFPGPAAAELERMLTR